MVKSPDTHYLTILVYLNAWGGQMVKMVKMVKSHVGRNVNAWLNYTAENMPADNRPSTLSVFARTLACRHIPLIVAHMGGSAFTCRVIDDLDGGPKRYTIYYQQLNFGQIRPIYEAT